MDPDAAFSSPTPYLGNAWTVVIWPYVVLFLISFIVVFATVPLCRRLATRLGVIDVPDERKIHEAPTPYLGGLSLFLGFSAACMVAAAFPRALASCWLCDVPMVSQPMVGLVVGTLIVVLVGLFDDVRGLRARTKFLVQLLLGGILYATNFRIELFTLPWRGPVTLPAWLSFPLTLLWVAGLINAINLIDGLDGLAAGVSCIGAIALFSVTFSSEEFCLVCMIAVIIAGCTLGFLRYNFHPASIFMGDAGSLMLGYLFAAISIFNPQKGATLLGLFIPIVVLAMAVIEITTTFIRRVRHKKRLGQPDRGHIHHRLLQLGLNQRQVVLLMYFISLFFAICAYLLKSVQDPAKRILVLLLIAIWTGIGVWVLAVLDRQGKARPKQTAVDRSVESDQSQSL